MKKRSMLAIASLAAGVVTALVSPTPHASAAEHSGAAGGVTGLLQEDQGLGTLVDQTVDGAGQALQTPRTGGLV
jgi:hypothetical protein